MRKPAGGTSVNESMLMRKSVLTMPCVYVYVRLVCSLPLSVVLWTMFSPVSKF